MMRHQSPVARSLGVDLQPRTLRRNIWRGLLTATGQEIHDGMSFYEGAHGLCRLFAAVFGTSVRQVAGIYAALSPMNGWLSNVDNVVAVLRHEYGQQPYTRDDPSTPPLWPILVRLERAVFNGHAAVRVNTPHPNRDKALRIAAGENPLSVLDGRKVTAFYHAIADPDDRTPIPVDRHLLCLALGIVPTKNQLARIASNADIYTRVEDAYTSLGNREGIGNRLASIAWFVQRRTSRSGQHVIIHPDAPVCCNRPMYSHGRPHATRTADRRRWYCASCRSTVRPERCERLQRDPPSSSGWTIRTSTEGFKLWRDHRSRACVTLGTRHPYANSGGWQYLARFLIAESLGYMPRTDEHTHHVDRDKMNDRLDMSNYELIAATYHGRIHGSAVCVARCTDTGRFMPLDQPGPEHAWPRYAAVLGNEAREILLRAGA